MKRLRWTVLKNALSNIVRGGATAAVALALPHFLTRALDTDRFAAWSLMLQIAAYATYLDFGLQTAIARFIAQTVEIGQEERRNNIVETAVTLLSLAGGLALLIIGSVIAGARYFFHGIPAPLLHEFQAAAITLTLGAAVLLPLSAYTGVLVGLHRNEFPAIAIGGSRLIGAAAAIFTAHYTHSLLALALCIVLPNLGGGLLQMVVAMRLLPTMPVLRIQIDRAVCSELMRYCAGLTVWSFGMLLVSGLDITIVGHFRFAEVGYYAVASGAIAMLAGVTSTVFSAFLTPIAAMHARGDYLQIRSVVLRATRISIMLNIAAACIVIVYGRLLLQLWVGAAYATKGYAVLAILMAAQTIRLSVSSYSIALIATGHQNRGILPVMVEALVNLAVSIWGAIAFGAVGVAIGTLAGAILGLSCVALYSVRLLDGLPLTRADFALRGLVPAILPVLPLCLAAAYIGHAAPNGITSALLWIATGGIAAFALRKAQLAPIQ